MTNEAVMAEGTIENAVQRVVYPADTFAKGSFATLMPIGVRASGALTTQIGAVCAGIAAAEKSPTNDTSTTLAFHTQGSFDCVASGAIVGGNPVQMAENNYVMQVAATSIASGAHTIGYAEETAADDETIRVRLMLG